MANGSCVALNHGAQQSGLVDAHGRGAEHRNRALRLRDQRVGARDRSFGRRGDFFGRGAAAGADAWRVLPRRRQRHVLRQVEMHRAGRLGERQRQRRIHRLDDAPPFKPERAFGDRGEQCVVVDPHLDAAPELAGVEIARDRDQRRAVEVGAADAGREIGGAGPERRDAQAGYPGHPSGHVGGETGRALVGGEHEGDAAGAHRLHQRQHVAARNAKAAVDPGRLEGRDDQVGIVHDGNSALGLAECGSRL